jgi:hypothetical protein
MGLFELVFFFVPLCGFIAALNGESDRHPPPAFLARRGLK